MHACARAEYIPQATYYVSISVAMPRHIRGRSWMLGYHQEVFPVPVCRLCTNDEQSFTLPVTLFLPDDGWCAEVSITFPSLHQHDCPLRTGSSADYLENRSHPQRDKSSPFDGPNWHAAGIWLRRAQTIDDRQQCQHHGSLQRHQRSHRCLSTWGPGKEYVFIITILLHPAPSHAWDYKWQHIFLSHLARIHLFVCA